MKNKNKNINKKKNQSKISNEMPLLNLKDIWPQERDLFIRPERLKYVRRLIKDEGCVFCNSAARTPTIETLCVYQTKHIQVLLNKFPYNNGHLLVIPKRHVGNIWDLTDKEYQDVFHWIRLSIQIIYEVYECDGVNMGLNHGSVAGAGIPEHIHFHIIPRWQGDVNFFPLIAECKVIIESLEDSYKKLRKAFLARAKRKTKSKTIKLKKVKK